MAGGEDEQRRRLEAALGGSNASRRRKIRLGSGVLCVSFDVFAHSTCRYDHGLETHIPFLISPPNSFLAILPTTPTTG